MNDFDSWLFNVFIKFITIQLNHSFFYVNLLLSLFQCDIHQTYDYDYEYIINYGNEWHSFVNFSSLFSSVSNSIITWFALQKQHKIHTWLHDRTPVVQSSIKSERLIDWLKEKINQKEIIHFFPPIYLDHEQKTRNRNVSFPHIGCFKSSFCSRT